MRIIITIDIEDDVGDDLLTNEEAAAELGMTAGALRSWVYRNKAYAPSGDRWAVEEIEAIRERRAELAKK